MPLAKRSTVVLVTHQTHLLAECEQIFLMADGRVLSSGKPADFLAEMQ
jgi:ABC-type transport system involved in cytochrome bd biosynthesis fused ATPase/permease subunit